MKKTNDHDEDDMPMKKGQPSNPPTQTPKKGKMKPNPPTSPKPVKKSIGKPDANMY